MSRSDNRETENVIKKNALPSGPEKIAYQGKMLAIVEQPMQVGDKKFTLEFARRSPGIRLIIPSSTGEILLTKEYRSELKGYDHRLPGGKVMDTLDEYNAFLRTNADIKEKAREAAVREAKEEVGILATDLELFAISRCGLTVEWDLYYFVVHAYEESSQELEEEENIVVTPTPITEARAMCLDGRISEERSALMLLRYLSK